MKHPHFARLLVVLALALSLVNSLYAQDTPSDGQIIFAAPINSTRKIQIMNADGSDLRPLDERDELENNPQLSPDGSLIAYIGRSENAYEVFVMNVDGSNPRQVTSFGVRFAPTFAWLQDSQQLIAQYYDTAAGTPVFNIMNIDGTVVGEIPIWGESLLSAFPVATLPDGEKFIFEAVVRVTNGSIRTLYRAEFDGTNLRALTPDIYVMTSALSPDGSQIAFISLGDSGTSSLQVVNADGSNLHTVTIPDLGDLQPFNIGWSPDGKRLVITAYPLTDQSQMQLYTLNIEGSAFKQITELEAGEPLSPPVWLPAAAEPAPESTPAS